MLQIILQAEPPSCVDTMFLCPIEIHDEQWILINVHSYIYIYPSCFFEPHEYYNYIILTASNSPSVLLVLHQRLA